MSVLIVGFFVVAVQLVVVVVDASAAYLHRQRLDSLADGAALAASDGIETDALYLEGVGDRLELDPAAVRARVAAYLREVGAFRTHPGLSFRVRTTAETVEVQVSSPLDLPLAPPGWAERTRVTGSAASYVQVLD
jgi:hypothetical protein